MLFGRVGFFVFGSAVCGALSGVSAQEMAVIPQVDVSGYQQDASTPQLLENKSAQMFTGNIPQVTEFGGNTISLLGLEESYATLIVPVMPELVSDVPNSPVAGRDSLSGPEIRCFMRLREPGMALGLSNMDMAMRSLAELMGTTTMRWWGSSGTTTARSSINLEMEIL